MTRTRRVTWVAGVLLLAPMVTATLAAAPASPASSAHLAGTSSAWVAYQWEGYVRLIHPDGAGDHIVTADVPPGPGQEHPDWSPDGQRLVMDVDFQALWVVDVDSAGQSAGAREVYRCQAPCAFVQDGAWSPDGKEIAFLRYSQDAQDPDLAAPPEVVGVNVDTGQLRVIYTSPKPSDAPFSPRWSPDGRRLVIDEARFASARLDEGEVTGERVVVVSADGSNTRQVLTDLTWFSGQVDWGHNGRIITSQGGNLWTLKPNGTHLRRITDYDDVNTHASQPTWTPTGNGVVFTYVRGQFGIDDRPTLGLTGPNGRNSAVWSARAPYVTHPRLQPTPRGGHEQP